MSNETPSPLDSSDNLAHTPPHVTQSHRSVYSTPKTNISRGSQVSQGARDKLLGLAPDGERCLITLDKEPLHCCHVVARALDHQIVAQLEYAWGMSTGELHLHSTRNMIYLRAEMHSRFDRRDWALVPTLEVLQRIATTYFDLGPGEKAAVYTKSFPNTIWEYHFVLFRRSPVAFLRFGQDSNSFETHEYPYENFGLIKSHVHPYFVICNAAQKENYHRNKAGYLAGSDSGSDLPPSRSTFAGHLKTCVRLYETWVPPPPASHLLEPAPTHRSSTSATSSCQSNRITHRSRAPQHDRGQASRGDDSHDVQYSLRSDVGNSRKRTRAGPTYAGVRSLPTPEQSQKFSDSYQRLVEDAVLDNNYSARSWTSIDIWVKNAKVYEPGQDPNLPSSESARLCLARYDQEGARCPPCGPWEEWVPEYELT